MLEDFCLIITTKSHPIIQVNKTATIQVTSRPINWQCEWTRSHNTQRTQRVRYNNYSCNIENRRWWAKRSDITAPCIRHYLVLRSRSAETTMHDADFLLLKRLSEDLLECNMVLHLPGIWLPGLKQALHLVWKKNNCMANMPVQKIKDDLCL